jgi:VWFA-related protein
LIRAGLLLALLSCSLPAGAQPRSSETIEVSIVNVEVVVTDREGRRVTGLTADDFEIREGGRLKPITHFAEYGSDISGEQVSVEVAPDSAPPAAAAVPVPRTIAIFIEAARLTPLQSKEMFDGVRDLLRKSLRPGDRASIVTWRNGSVIRQPFTDDLAQLERVLGELEQEMVRGPREMARDVRRDQGEADSDAAEMGAGGMPPVHALEAARRQLDDIKRKTIAIEALMQSIAPLDGRKIVILGMRRFGVHAGVEYFGGDVPIDYRTQLSTEKLHDSLIRTANASSITLYPVYPAGLRSDAGNDPAIVTPEADDIRFVVENRIMINETTALSHIADRTGGLTAWGSGNIAKLLPRVAEDMDAYYSLAYRASTTGKDASRKIEVRTKNPAYRVRSRGSFVEKSDQTRMSDRVVANLYHPLPGASLPFSVTFGQVRRVRRNRTAVPLIVRVPIGSLTTLPSGSEGAGSFSVYVVTGSESGIVSDVRNRTQAFRIPRSDLERAKASHFTYELTLEVDDDVDRISVGVLDDTSSEFGLRRIRVPSRER